MIGRTDIRNYQLPLLLKRDRVVQRYQSFCVPINLSPGPSSLCKSRRRRELLRSEFCFCSSVCYESLFNFAAVNERGWWLSTFARPIADSLFCSWRVIQI
jgi:hypothetical protein